MSVVDTSLELVFPEIRPELLLITEMLTFYTQYQVTQPRHSLLTLLNATYLKHQLNRKLDHPVCNVIRALKAFRNKTCPVLLEE